MYIKIKAHLNGSHDNFSCDQITNIHDEYAYIPNNVVIPSTFPFVDIEVENGIVIKMTANQKAYDKAISLNDKIVDESVENIINIMLGV